MQCSLARRLVRSWYWLLLALVFAAGLAVLRFQPLDSLQAGPLLAELRTLSGPVSALLLFGVFVLATATVVPAAPFSVAAGLLLGAAGFPLALAAATCGASVAFVVARRFLRNRVARWIAGRPLPRALDQVIAQQGWRIVFLIRLSPLLPFNVQNYLFGASRVAFRPYVLATAAGIVPNTALYVYLGSVGRDSLAGAGPAALILPGIGILCFAAAMLLVARAARRTLLAAVAAS